MIDASYATNSSKYNFGGTINFQAQSSSGNWVNNMIIEKSLAASSPNEELFIRNLFESYEGKYYLEIIK